MSGAWRRAPSPRRSRAPTPSAPSTRAPTTSPAPRTAPRRSWSRAPAPRPPPPTLVDLRLGPDDHRHGHGHRRRPGHGHPAGSVLFSDGTQTCTGTVSVGVATCTFIETLPGTYTFSAIYSSTNDFTGSSDSAAAVVVTGTSTTATTTDEATYVSGQTITVTATVTAVARRTGTPRAASPFSDGTQTCTGTVNVRRGDVHLHRDAPGHLHLQRRLLEHQRLHRLLGQRRGGRGHGHQLNGHHHRRGHLRLGPDDHRHGHRDRGRPGDGHPAGQRAVL